MPSWRHGRRIEVYGSGGVTYANLHMGNALPTYSESDGYAVEKAPSTQGWSYPVFEELWNMVFLRRCPISRFVCEEKKTRKQLGKMG